MRRVSVSVQGAFFDLDFNEDTSTIPEHLRKIDSEMSAIDRAMQKRRFDLSEGFEMFLQRIANLPASVLPVSDEIALLDCAEKRRKGRKGLHAEIPCHEPRAF